MNAPPNPPATLPHLLAGLQRDALNEVHLGACEAANRSEAGPWHDLARAIAFGCRREAASQGRWRESRHLAGRLAEEPASPDDLEDDEAA